MQMDHKSASDNYSLRALRLRELGICLRKGCNVKDNHDDNKKPYGH